jgi:hypothetical protein
MSRIPLVPLLLAASSLAGCADPGAPLAARTTAAPTAAAPAGLVTDAAVGRFWPYTGTDFSGAGQDPINLVFTGVSDPRRLRALLLSLDGDRSALGLPNVPPFDCTWSDAIGDLQTGYADAGGWTGSAIQLQCGAYGPVRFHLRLFAAGAATIANAHFEVLIPGTADHQVLSWELAERLVAGDLGRSGRLDEAQPPRTTAAINASPFREVPAIIYDGLPAGLRALIGGPLGDVSDAVPIATDGRATVLAVASAPPVASGTTTQDFTLTYHQAIPKPFCAAPGELVFVDGPVHLVKQVTVDGSGAFASTFDAAGTLAVTPLDAGGAPAGATYRAEVAERQETTAGDGRSQVRGLVQRTLFAGTGAPSRLAVRLTAGPNGQADYRPDVRCGD